ncbi:MAG TPA: Type 1 glutamine amidotransferase-like domain-containing protein [Acidobacteriota bacterium]|nr:Type 1 glutamine amidotransferase-like domain-containing protein [Acidobacteriota bacterium]
MKIRCSVIAFFIISVLFATHSVEAKVTRYLTGNPADVNPILHGPVLDLGGGSTDVDEAFQWMFNEVRGCPNCSAKLDVVILRATGADGYNDYLFAMNGVDSVETLVITKRTEADTAEVETTVRNAEVVFFAGGDQCDYVRIFKGTVVETAVESVYARGGGIGGTSAGCAIQGDVTFDACNGTIVSEQALSDPFDRRVSLSFDFFHWQFMEGTITDQHFQQRDRMGRTMAFIARLINDQAASSILAVAVNERTSVVVDQNGKALVMGNGPAFFVLGDHFPEVCQPKVPLTFSDYKIWRREAGETFDLRNRPTSGYYLRSVVNGVIQGDPYQP